MWERYLTTVGNFLTGNFGISIQAGVPVSQQLATNLPPTLLLASLAFTAALVLTIILAALSNMVGMEWLRAGLQSLPSLFHFGAGLLARHHADPDLLLPARPRLGHQPARSSGWSCPS